MGSKVTESVSETEAVQKVMKRLIRIYEEFKISEKQKGTSLLLHSFPIQLCHLPLPRQDSNLPPSGCESAALPLDHGSQL